jgi:chemotaxis response regulator CheB
MAIYSCELAPAQLTYVAKKVVLLWGYEDLIGFSVEFLLTAHKDLQVVKIADDQDIDTLLKAVEEFQPNSVILHLQNHVNNIDLPLLLMRNQQSLKVIVVNLHKNSVEIFTKQQVCLNESSDLVSIVEGCPHLPHYSEDAES